MINLWQLTLSRKELKTFFSRSRAIMRTYHQCNGCIAREFTQNEDIALVIAHVLGNSYCYLGFKIMSEYLTANHYTLEHLCAQETDMSIFHYMCTYSWEPDYDEEKVKQMIESERTIEVIFSSDIASSLFPIFIHFLGSKHGEELKKALLNFIAGLKWALELYERSYQIEKHRL